MSLANAGNVKYVGRRTKRSDAPERLTGKVRYVADLPLLGRPRNGLPKKLTELLAVLAPKK